jgi:hypothetical protein
MLTSYQKDDVFLIPVTESSAAVGRVVMKLKGGNVLVAAYPEVGADTVDLQKLSECRPALLVETMDLRLKDGKWKLLGKYSASADLGIPVYKVQLEPDGDFFEQMIDGSIGNRLTRDESARMRRLKSFSPAAVEMAVRALLGLSPWLPDFDEMKFDPLE